MITRRTFVRSAASAALAGAGADAFARTLRSGLAQAAAGPGLKQLVPAPVLIGAVVDRWQMEDPRWQQLILANFNLITLGRLKWGFVRPTAATFDFSETDWMVSFCEHHGLAMHGHNLCWDANNPAWLAQTLTPSNAQHILEAHIATVMQRYAGKVTSWDVVNEPIATWMGRPDSLYKGPWLDALGPQYIDIAFHAAAAADPKPLRVLNTAHVEQGGHGDDGTRAATLRLVEGMLKRGVPVQAVGFESHLAGDYPASATASRIDFVHELRQMGLKVLLTEVDVDDTRLPADQRRRDALVSDCYGEYLASMLKEAQPERIIFFTPGDQKNWYDAIHAGAFVRSDGAPHRPGLFDTALAPKPAYASVAAALRGYRG